MCYLIQECRNYNCFLVLNAVQLALAGFVILPHLRYKICVIRPINNVLIIKLVSGRSVECRHSRLSVQVIDFIGTLTCLYLSETKQNKTSQKKKKKKIQLLLEMTPISAPAQNEH